MPDHGAAANVHPGPLPSGPEPSSPSNECAQAGDATSQAPGTTGTGASEELASALRMAVLRLARQLRQQDASSDMTISQLSALSVVAGLGMVTLGDLAAAERVQPPTMTRVAATLESQGLVERVNDPNDRRVTRLRPTEAGIAALAESRSRRTAYLWARLQELDPEDREVLRRSLSVFERLAGET